MILNCLYLVVGIALILWGADKFTDGACGVARKLKVSELMIGMTVVAFGTSMPEFVVSFFSSLKGSADMAVGNIYGSNLFNTLVIVGGSALVAPMALQRVTTNRDLPVNALFALLIAAVCFVDVFGMEEANTLGRWEGLVVLALFLGYMGYSIVESRRGGVVETGDDEGEEMAAWKVVAYVVVGIACLVGGGELLVDAATEIAQGMGVSETVIGLTILAGGTSLPELATSLMAARKGRSSLAIGNAVGSNLFNIGFVLGVCSTVSPMEIEGITLMDGVALVVSALLLWYVGRTDHLIKRSEGAVLLVAYVGYLAWKILTQAPL